MRIRKVLSLAVVLAMVLTVVPMFGITASAAAPSENAPLNDVQALITGGTCVFDGTNGLDEMTHTNQGAFDWESAQGDWAGWSGDVKLYGWKDSHAEFLDAGNTNGKLNASNTVVQATSNKDYIVLTWIQKSENNNNGYIDYKILDASGEPIDTFRLRGSSVEGLNPAWANSGYLAGFSGIAAEYDYEDNFLIENGVADGENNDSRTKYFMVYTNLTDDGYTASYYYKDGDQIKWIGTKTFAEGKVNGFSGYEVNKVNGGWVRTYETKIYAGDLTDVTVNYKAGEQTIGTGSIKAVKGLTITPAKLSPDVVANESGSYVKDSTGNDETYVVKATTDENSVDVKYTKKGLTIDPIDVVTRKNVAAKLPSKATADGESYTVDVEWGENKTPDTTDSYTVNGHMKGNEALTITANVTVKDSVEDLLIADYKFDGDLKDSISGNTPATANGDLKYNSDETAVILDGGKKTDGGDERKYITLPDAVTDKIIEATDNGGGFTISAYVKKTVIDNQFLFNMFAGETANAKAFGIIDSTGADAFRFESAYDQQKTSKLYSDTRRDIVDDRIVKLTVTFDYNSDGYGEVKFYENGVDISREGGGVEVSHNMINFTPGDLKNESSDFKSYIGLSSYGGDRSYNGEIDEFKIYSVALTPDEVKADIEDVTVEYQVNGEIAKTVELSIPEGRKVPAVNFAYDGKYYHADEVVPSGQPIEAKLVQKNNSSDNYTAPSSDFSYNFKDNAQLWAGDNGAIDIRKEATISIGWGGWSAQALRQTIMTFPVKVDEGKVIKSAKLNLHTFYTNGAATYEIYAIDPSKVDVTNSKLTGYKSEDYGLTTGGYVADQKAYSEIMAKVKDEFKAQLVGTEESCATNEDKTITLDLSKADVTGGTLALLVASPNQIYTSSATTENGPYLTDIEIVPEAPEASLGWDGKNFTINYTGEQGQTIKVYHEDEKSGDMTAMEGEGTKELTEGITGVAVAPSNANRIYTAAIIDGVEGVQSAKTSVYKLVVDALADATTIADDKKTAINDVIAEGGIYLVDGSQLTSETNGIFDGGFKGTTGTIKQVLFDNGIGFVVGENGIYIGSNETTNDVAATASGADTAKVYRTIEINVAENTITLKDDATGQEAITLSLDSVNIEFIETLIEEAESNGADAEADFIPEL